MLLDNTTQDDKASPHYPPPAQHYQPQIDNLTSMRQTTVLVVTTNLSNGQNVWWGNQAPDYSAQLCWSDCGRLWSNEMTLPATDLTSLHCSMKQCFQFLIRPLAVMWKPTSRWPDTGNFWPDLPRWCFRGPTNHLWLILPDYSNNSSNSSSTLQVFFLDISHAPRGPDKNPVESQLSMQMA